MNGTAVLVAVKVAVSEVPATLAVTVAVPGVPPSVSVDCAIPLAFVVVLEVESDPPPLVIA